MKTIKLWIQILLFLLMILLSGCSNRCEARVKYIQSPKVKFYITDINLTEIEKIYPKDIKVQGEVVITSLKTFQEISNQNKRLHIHKDIYKKSFLNLSEQVKRYQESK